MKYIINPLIYSLMKSFFEKQVRDEKFFRNVRAAVQSVILLLTIGIGFSEIREYAVIGFFWLISNEFFYYVGSHEICIDEWEDGYPYFGVRRMFKSWLVFVPCACFAAYGIYSIF